jgi:hypothetical protein
MVDAGREGEGDPPPVHGGSAGGDGVGPRSGRIGRRLPQRTGHGLGRVLAARPRGQAEQSLAGSNPQSSGIVPRSQGIGGRGCPSRPPGRRLSPVLPPASSPSPAEQHVRRRRRSGLPALGPAGRLPQPKRIQSRQSRIIAHSFSQVSDSSTAPCSSRPVDKHDAPSSSLYFCSRTIQSRM